MRITFGQQNATEQIKEQNNTYLSGARTEERTREYCSAGYYKPGNTWDAMWGNRSQKGKSLIELQQEAEQADVGVTQDYMTLMSNTISKEDYAKLQEKGFDFGDMTPEEAVTIVDKIKIELIRSGKQIEGYTDDLDIDTLAAALGNPAVAASLAGSFGEADLPIDSQMTEELKTAWSMAEELRPLEEGAIRYLVDNGLEPEVWNLYLAQNSGADITSGNMPEYAVEEVSGYYSKTAESENWQLSEEQIEDCLKQWGLNPDTEAKENAGWLLDQGLPLTRRNMDLLAELKGIQLPIDARQFGKAMSKAVSEGTQPIHAALYDADETIYQKAVRLEEYFQGPQISDRYSGDIAARRQLEEVRLHMTAEVNLKLLKSGFSIDTAPMEELIAALKKAEEELAGEYFPEDAEAPEKYRVYNQTETAVKELPGLPADVLGAFSKAHTIPTAEEVYLSGKELQEKYSKAGQSYEALMTSPRADLGDSIRKAFANVDDILRDLGQELTEENRRAVRILGYNRMEITLPNMESVKEADRQVSGVIQKLTPAATLQMIRDGVNPMEKTFAELEEYFRKQPESFSDEADSYSRFLYGLERNQEISPEERESYIGIYRLVRQLEKGDGAAVGAIVNTQAQLQFSGLLNAVRTLKSKGLDVKVDNSFGAVEKLLQRGESISRQIEKAFVRDASSLVTDVSYSKELEAEYNTQQLMQYKEAVANTDRDCIAMLQRGQLSATAENLMAAEHLLYDGKNLFATSKDNNRGAKLWEKLSEAKEFREEYRSTTQKTIEAIEEEVPLAENSLDVRSLKLAHKQLGVVAKLAENQEFFLPFSAGGKVTKVHLRLQHNGEGKASVEIFVKDEDKELLSAFFEFKGDVLQGRIESKQQEKVMNLKELADNFTKEAGLDWKVGEIITDTNRFNETGAGAGTDAKVDNMELYRVAKIFLQAVQEGYSYEN